MNNRKKILHLFYFSSGTLIALTLFSFIVDFGVRHSNEEEFKKVNIIISQHIDPDIIAFGSSVGEKAFNSNIIAAKTNCTAYNACLDGTNFEQYRGVVEEYNSYSGKPALVLFFESYFSLYKLNAISSIERYAAYLDRPSIYESLFAIDSDITWRSRYIPFYKNTVVNHTYYKAAIMGWKCYLSKKPILDVQKGHLPMYRGWEADQDAAIDNIKPFRLIIQPQVVKEYKQMINNLQQKGKRVIIVLPPVYQRLYKEKVDFSPLHDTLLAIAGTTHCGFLDFTQSPMTCNKNNFYNANHLNNIGADLFSNILADSLKQYIQPQLPKSY